MKRLLPAGLLIVLGSAACDSPAGPPKVSDVVVTPETHTMNVGATVQLSAQARSSSGEVVTGTTIAWNSLDPGVATVSLTGLVSAAQPGTARIVASASGRADTAVITVTAPGASCTPASTLTMSVGEARRLSGAAASAFCLEGTAGGAEFTIVPFYETASQRATVALTFEASGVESASGPPNPSISPAAAAPLSIGGGHAAARAPDGGFHLRLRERTEPALRPLIPSARALYRERRRSGGPRFDMAAAPPQVGQILTFNVETDGRTYTEVCETMSDFRTGRVEAVGARAVIVADTANPSGGLTPADYQHVAATMDTLVWPVVAGTFGEPADIDVNQRVVIFYTRAVNELTPKGANYVVGGFFYSRDLFPKTDKPGFQGCPLSNEAEMFYMLAADPTGEVNDHVRTTEDVVRSTIGTVGHELQHLISASRRLYVIDAGATYNEEVWLNEGLSHIAEELMFYRSSGLAPLSNISLDDLRASERRVNAVNSFQINNLSRFSAYLKAPESSSPFSPDDELATRGSAWAFLRYAADRRGGNQQQLWYDLVNNPRLGLANLEHHIGVDPRVWARDWNVSLYTDDAVAGVGPELRNPSWNFRSIYPAITTGYPLSTRQLTASGVLELSLRASGAAYVRTAVPAGGRGTVEVTSGGAALPSSVTLTVVRTR